LSIDDLNSRLCNNVDFQKVTFTTPGIYSYSISQLNTVKNNFISLLSVDSQRVFINQSTNSENQSEDGEIILSVSKSSGTEPEHSSIIYNFTQLWNNPTTKLSLFSNSSINGDETSVETLTFNETVGTKPGCYVTNSSGISLLIGNSVSCSLEVKTNPQNSNGDMIVPIIISVAIGALASIVIVIVISLLIPGIRRAIFPKNSSTGKLELKERVHQNL